MASPVQGNGKVTPPLETKANMDKDYDYYIAKYNTRAPPPAPGNPPPSRNLHNNKYHGNLGVTPMEPVMEQVPMGTPPRPPSKNRADPDGSSPEEKVDGSEALLDLAQLEELHHEAERMKALGNKHMAAQVCLIKWITHYSLLELRAVDLSASFFDNFASTGIYTSLQRLFSRLTAFSSRTVLACFLVE
jgi:hypothetical protein